MAKLSYLETLLTFPLGTKVRTKNTREIMEVIDHYDSDWAGPQVRTVGLWGSTNYWPADILVSVDTQCNNEELTDVTD